MHSKRTRRRTKKYEMAMKLDMAKAYDRVEWDYLKALMIQMGFSLKWVSLIMQCVSTVRYNVMVNGENAAQFNPSRGIRQGDPLSPYLFILLTESLTILMNKAMEGRLLLGLKVNRVAPRISHLLFADDSIFFSIASRSQCLVIMDILNRYCYATGQLINLNKSGVTFSSMSLLRV